MIKIYNTLTRKKEEFKPLVPPKVTMYACGVTVYDHCHIGHARSLYLFELIRRYLAYRGFEVTFVRNITDVDDKIINRAGGVSREKYISLKEAFDEVRNTYIDSYYQDLALLNIPAADVEPRATENISQMQAYVQKLIEKGYAYEREGNVYFSVRKFKPYGKLSGKKINDLLESVRIEPNPCKEDPLDFALWKKAKEDEPYWMSPWGKGRPGWHIECSVMSQKYLHTDTLDIHGGGRDLVFPHHENEIAQSEALTGKPFALIWIHHGLLTINGQKMAKSLGNFVTIKDIIKKYPADVLKLFYLGAHYGSVLDFSWKKMEETQKAYERIVILREKLRKRRNESSEIKYKKRVIAASKRAEKYRKKFIEYMDDDFNTARALSVVFELVNECNRLLGQNGGKDDVFLDKAQELLEEFSRVSLLSFEFEKELPLPIEEIETVIHARIELKKKNDYKGADAIRNELQVLGIILEDNRDGTTSWRMKR